MIIRSMLGAAAANLAAAALGVAAAAQAPAPAPAQAQGQIQGPVPGPFSEGFADLSDRLSPAVVNIRTSQTVQGGVAMFAPGSPLERFNEYLGNSTPRTESALGSGFVIDAKGVIVTNNHVIEGADAIEVAFPDGRSFEATVVGRDPGTDLAVLKVKSETPLPYVPFGDSDRARVGDWVVAIGNPFGLGQTLTVGVISARNRDIKSGSYDDFIQTDAAINRGNSGGPLFNLRGEVIGVNSAILSPGAGGGSVGIGFSIPSQLTKTVVDQLLKYGETRRGWLGVGIQHVTPEIAEAYGLDKPKGALIVHITDDGPAAKAGLQQGDLILSFDGKEVADDRAFTRMVADSTVGKDAAVSYMREKQTKIATIKIDRAKPTEDKDVKSKNAAPEAPGSVDTVLGITLAPLDDAARRRYDAPDADGLLVTGVKIGTDAAGKVQVGDVIEEIAWEKVTTAKAAAEATEAAAKQGKPILLLINRGGQPVFVSIRPPGK
jgi:serine protease Do